MASKTQVTSNHGVVYTVRLVRNGDHYGSNFCLVHDKEDPLVEFYDAKNTHDYDFVGSREDAKAAGAEVLGQYVSRYYLSTLLESAAVTPGINLCGHVPRWVIDGDALREALSALGCFKQPAEGSLLYETLAFLREVVQGRSIPCGRKASELLHRHLDPENQ